MNAFAPIIATSPLQEMAEAIRNGDLKALPIVGHELYETADWQASADYALDSDDFSELEHMLAREAAWNEFQRFVAADEWKRESDDFGVWLVRKARWNMRKYSAALTWAESRSAES